MPPKKKAKGSVGAASTPVADEDTPMNDVSEEKPTYDILQDPWTDEQETSLFKGIIKWKPAGMHKHFRMIALSEHLRNHGYDPTIEKHTRIPAIWAKLQTLYNLETIDEMENAHSFNAAPVDHYAEFSLPQEEYGMTMFLRGQKTASEAPSSPPRLHEEVLPKVRGKRARRGSTVDDTDETRSSPARSVVKSSVRGRGRGGRWARDSSRAESTQETQESDAEETEDVEEEEEEEEGGTPSPKVGRGKRKAKEDGVGTRKSKRTR